MTTATPTYCVEALAPAVGAKQATMAWFPGLSWEEANHRYDDACQECPAPYVVILHREGGAPVYRREADGTTYMNSTEAGNAPAYTPDDEKEAAPEPALADRLGETEAAVKAAAAAFRKQAYALLDALQVYGDAVKTSKALAHDALQAAMLTGEALDPRDALTALQAVEESRNREGRAQAIAQLLHTAVYLA